MKGTEQMSISTSYPLTELQRSYVIGRVEEEIATKVIYELIVPSIKIQALEKAIEKTIIEQPALNSYISGENTLKIREEVTPFHISMVDISLYSNEKQQKFLDEIFDKFKHNLWNTVDGYPMNICAVKLSENETRLIIDFDMIIFDGMSIKLFADKVSYYYDNPESNPIVDNGFFNYCSSIDTMKKSRFYKKAQEYWLSDEQCIPSSPDILHYNSNMSGENAIFDRCTMYIKENEWKVIKANIQQQGIQPYVFMLALYSKMLAVYSGTSRFTVNVPVTNRKSLYKKTIGDFTSVLLIDIDTEQKNVYELCTCIYKKMMSALKNKHFDGIQVMRNIALGANEESTHFPIVFTPMLYHDFSIPMDSPMGVIVRGCSQTTNVLLDCQIYEYGKGLSVNLDYRRNSFNNKTINNMFDLLCKDIKSFSDLRYFKDEEFLKKIAIEDLGKISKYNNTYGDISSYSLMDLLEDCFEKHKNKTAILCKNQTMTFGELWEQSEEVCGYLLHQGVRRGDTVAVLGKRSIETIVNCLGVMKCGATYVPIDITQPENRKKAIIEKARCKAIITDDIATKNFKGIFSRNITHSPEDIAYIIFTSGSTGEPKGVSIKHRAVMNTVLDINKRYNVTEKDVIACVSSIGFDLSIYDIFSVFVTGAELVLIPDVYNVEEMITVLSESGVTIWNSVPAIFRLIIDFLIRKNENNDLYYGDYALDDGQSTTYILSLRLVMLSGDWISKNIVEKALQMFDNCKIVSLGGATEASIWSIYYDIEEIKPEWESIPYGYPLTNQTIYILDNNQRLAPIGARGEICIGGAGVAEGYYEEIEKTASQFCLHEMLGKIYHTGDYGFMSPEGYIVLLGRKDNQVKINGFRVELGEIENVIKKLSYVKNAVAVVMKLKSGTKAICAYVSLYKSVDTERIRKDSAESLPHYMIPSKVVILDNLPLTTNGKISRKDLPNPYDNITAVDLAKSEWEIRLIDMWKKYLRIEDIHVDSHFIELGGDSLAMIGIVNEIKEKFNVEISFKKFMVLGTICEIARYIEDNINKSMKIEKAIYTPIRCRSKEKKDKFSLTDIQMSYFIGRNSGMEMGNISTHAYYEVENNFDISRLNVALNKVIESNPMLRMVITPDGKQKILENVDEYVIHEEDISKLSPQEQEKILINARNERSHRVIDIFSFPLFEFHAIRLTSKRVRLLVEFDLLISDGISMRIFIKELMKHYKADIDLNKNEKFDFHDYIFSLNGLKKTQYYKDSEKYWSQQLDSFSGAPSLPVKMSPKDIVEPVFNRCRYRVLPKKWDAIKKSLSKYGITPSTYLMTVYGRILAYYSNAEKVTLNVTTFTRFPFDDAVKDMMGDFTSVMLVDVDSKPQFSDACHNIQEKIAENLEYKVYDGVSVIRSIAQKKNRGGELLFPYVFTSMIFENQDLFDIDDIGDIVYDVSQTSQVYLDCQIMSEENGINITWDYVSQLFDKAMMENMFSEFIRIIENSDETLSGIENTYLTCNDEEFIKKYNATEHEYNVPTLIEAFEETVRRMPEKIAVITEKESVTYAELNDRAECIASGLEVNGVEKGDRVAIYEYRNINTVAAIVAILKCGAVYVPISPGIPSERKKFIFENCGINIELTKNKTRDLLKSAPFEKKHHKPKVDDEAYIIYTSGSTGRPKGVIMTHEGAMNTIVDINKKFRVTRDDVILGVSSFTFDLSVYDLFGTFYAGAQLVLAQDGKDTQKLRALITDYSVTVWNSVPAIISFVMDNNEEENVDYFDEAAENVDVIFEETNTLRLVMLSGDYIPMDIPNKIRNKFVNAEIISLGGATEGGIWSIYYPVGIVDKNWSVIPYGYPLSNQQIYILNRENNLCPIMIEGEIAIGGKSLSLGYCNDKIKTEAAFINHPTLGRLYKTGDLGAYNFAGYIEFHGRKDNQVKINGYRVELGEIESSLLRMDNILSAVAVISEKNKNNILAFYVSEKAVDNNEIIKFLETQIPSYMMPTVIRKVESLPVTANGKIDRKKLSSTDILSSDRTIIVPRTENEKVLYRYFCEALDIDEFSVTDSFFELGGDSIKGISMFNKLSEEYEIELNLIFRYQTVEQLAKHIKQRKNVYIDERINKLKKQYYTISDDECRVHIDDMYKNYLQICLNDKTKIEKTNYCYPRKIMITGATGYIGAYITERILVNTTAEVYLTARGDDSESRLRENLLFYFGNKMFENYKKRIHCISCDFSKNHYALDEKLYGFLLEEIEIVINCIGKVQHLGKHEDFMESNVESVRRLIEFCLMGRRKVLHHLSTTRVSENLPSKEGIIFSEYTNVETKLSEEIYVQTKKEAEDLIIQATKNGLEANIYRVGTVLFDSCNGHFQKNIETNSFYLIMQAFFELGAMPNIDSELLDFTFVDQCAEAIVRLVLTRGIKGEIFHIFNPNKLSMYEFYEKLKDAGMKEKIDMLEFEEFFDFVYEKYKDENARENIDTLLLHSSSYMPMDKGICVVVNDKTCETLKKLGFTWTAVSEKNIVDMLDYGQKIKFFEEVI